MVQEEKPHTGEFLISEASRTRSRAKGKQAASQSFRPGLLLAMAIVGAASAVATAASGNTGNGVFGAITVDAEGAPVGTWRLVIIEPGANVGTFTLERPDGTVDGTGKVATAYNGGLNFTLADGATDFAAGDAFEIEVTLGSAEEQLIAWELGKKAVGLAWDWTETGAGETKEGVVYIEGDAEVNGHLIAYPEGSTLGDKVEAREQLRRLGIKVR